MQKIIYLPLVFLLLTTHLVSQDVHFSQPSVGNVNLNPSLAGNDSVGRIGIVYRNQWSNLIGNYTTTSVNGYQYISKLNAYGGINYINDVQAKTFYSNNISLFYGQNINIKHLLIRPAIEIGYSNIRIDKSQLNFGDMIDYRRGFAFNSNEAIYITSKQYFNLNLGFLTYYKNISLGLSIHHLNQPDIGLLSPSKLPMRFGVQLGYQLNLNKISFSPYVIYQQQQNFTMLIGGVNTLLFKHFNIGLSYRNSDAFITAISFQNHFFRITYSYDYTTSSLANYNSGGTHEISTVFNFWKTAPKYRLIKVKNVFS